MVSRNFNRLAIVIKFAFNIVTSVKIIAMLFPLKSSMANQDENIGKKNRNLKKIKFIRGVEKFFLQSGKKHDETKWMLQKAFYTLFHHISSYFTLQ